MVTHISVQMSAESRPSFSDIVLELEATSEEDDEEKPAALGKTHLYISKENMSKLYDKLRLRS